MNFILEFNQEYENTTATELNEAIQGNRTRRSLTTKQLDAKAKLIRINLLGEELATNRISISYFLDSISKFYLANGKHAEVLVILKKCLKLFLFLTILFNKCYYSLYSASLPGNAFPLSRGIPMAVEELIVNPRVPFLAPVVMDVNIDIPPLVPIYQRYDIADPVGPVPVQDAAYVEPIAAEAELPVEPIPAEAELTFETIPLEAANMVEPVPVEAAYIIEPVRVELTERQRIAYACREAAQVRMRAIEHNLASERGLPALRIFLLVELLLLVKPLFPLLYTPLFLVEQLIWTSLIAKLMGKQFSTS